MVSSNKSFALILSILIGTLSYFLVDYSLGKINLSNKGLKPKILLNLDISQQDEFRLFYSTSKIKRWTGQNSEPVSVNPKDSSQLVVLELPNTPLKRLRIDLGINEKQRQIKINSIGIYYNRDLLELDQAEIDSAFKLNQFVESTNTAGLYNLIVKDNRKKYQYDPFLIAEPWFLKTHNDFISKKIHIPYVEMIAFIIALATAVFIYLRTQAKNQQHKNVYSYTIVVIFIILIIAPTYDQIARKEQKTLENRKLNNQFPTFKISEIELFPAKFANFYGDSFGFRNQLVSLGAKLKAKIFNATSSDDIIIGKDNWVFIAKGFNLFDNYIRNDLYTREKLNKLSRTLIKRKAKLEKDSIKYYLTYYPNKHSIYEEYIPWRMRTQKIDTVKRTNQLTNFLKGKKATLEIITYEELLKAHKDSVQLYYKVDSHWNSYGAFLAYQKLFNIISQDFPEITPFTIDDFDIKWIKRGAGYGERGSGHLNLIGFDDKDFFLDNKPNFELKNAKMASIIEKPTKGYPPKTVIHVNKNLPNGKTVVIFRDSFTNALIPYISPLFKKTIYIWTNYNEKIVKKEKPDIVIESYVERYFF